MSQPLLPDSIVVTGGTGFIGRHLVRQLVAMGSTPTLLVRSVAKWDREIESQLRQIEIDLFDGEGVAKYFGAAKPSLVFHLAGTRGCGAAARFISCAELNIVVTARLLELAKRHGVQRVVIVGSAEEYGMQPGPLKEDLPLRPTSAYGISKATATLFARSLADWEELPVVILRPFTVYGPGQPPDMFVAEAIQCAVREIPFQMSEGKQYRDFVFVEDVIRALISAALTPNVEGEVINIAGGCPYELRQVASLIWALSGSKAPLMMGARPSAPHEMYDTWADLSRARSLLQWTPQVDLEAGLKRTIEWMRQRLPHEEPVWLAE